MKNIKKLISLLVLTPLLSVQAQTIDLGATEEYSPYVFGFNLEHTRSAVGGGLSAQMLKNRKFAGKPQANLGLAAHWFPIGKKVFYFMNAGGAYTKHICLPNMRRGNERWSQVIENLTPGQTAGMGQHQLGLAAGKTYELRMVTRVNKALRLKVELTDRSGERVYAGHTLELAPAEDWVISEFTLTPREGDEEADIRYTFTEQAELTIGALSMMPQENFHGMRRDVVDHLKAIGPRLIRWPGGNFAGEYRWKDGLLDADQRAPLQAYTEIETQPHSDGYDYHEINTDDFIALCREVGAEPLITINLGWESPEESAQWVEYCNGGPDTEYGKMRAERGHKEPYNVSFWSLGNEMGYGHMEGPNGSEKYTEFALNHADAMLKVTPGLKLFASGPYPSNDWAQKSAAKMAEKVKYISLHTYFSPRGGFHYTTPEGIKTTYENIAATVMNAVSLARNMRKCLDDTGHKLHISYDEWNQWYAWYRPSCVSEGIFTARMMHFFLNYANELDMPVVCYFQPVGEGAIIIDRLGSRLTANGQVFSLMKAHQDGKLCKVTGNDDLSTVATLRDGVLTLTLINEKYDEERTFSFPIEAATLKDAVIYSSDDVTPYSYFKGSPLQVKCEKGHVSTVLPPHSVALIRLNIQD